MPGIGCPINARKQEDSCNASLHIQQSLGSNRVTFIARPSGRCEKVLFNPQAGGL